MSDEPGLRETSERFYVAVDAVLHGDEGPMLAARVTVTGLVTV